MIDLGPISHYLGMEINILVGKVVIMQKSYVEKLLESPQISKSNTLPIAIVEGLNLQTGRADFTSKPTDVIAY